MSDCFGLRAALALLPPRLPLLLSLLTAAAACAPLDPAATGDSQFADEQPREDYINSAAYYNVQLGVGYLKQGEFGIALSKFKKALQQNPDLAIAHSSIAVLYEEMNEDALAERHYKKSISLDANDARLRNNYGQFLCRHDEPLEGIEQFETAAANPLYKTPSLPLTNAGICALSVNQDAMAEEFLRRALEKTPDMLPALGGMVQLKMKRGEFAQARDYLHRYTALTPPSADILWAGYRIEKHLGNIQAATDYAARLQADFPDSKPTALLLREAGP